MAKLAAIIIVLAIVFAAGATVGWVYRDNAANDAALAAADDVYDRQEAARIASRGVESAAAVGRTAIRQRFAALRRLGAVEPQHAPNQNNANEAMEDADDRADEDLARCPPDRLSDRNLGLWNDASREVGRAAGTRPDADSAVLGATAN